MQKNVRGRVLARVLAEDLRNLRGNTDPSVAPTVTVTEPYEGHPRRDITNNSTDGDLQ